MRISLPSSDWSFNYENKLERYIYFLNAMDEINSSVSNIGGFDAPTDIYVTNSSLKISGIIITVILAVVSGIGIYKTRRR